MKPEQTFFTLEEAAERLSCTADDVLRFGAFHSLGMGAIVTGAKLAELLCRAAGDTVVCGQNSPEPLLSSGFFRLKADDLQVIKSYGVAVPRILYPYDSVPGELKDKDIVYHIKEWLGPPLKIGKENLLIFANELNRFHAEMMVTAVQNDIESKRRGREEKIPVSLLGDSFSEEMRQKHNALTRYTQLETWTPAEAAMLVSGLCPPDDCEKIPDLAKGLDGIPTPLWDYRLRDARDVLRIWRSRENPPARVKPSDFIAWCKTRGIDTGWLRSIEQPQLGEQGGEETPEERYARIYARYTQLSSIKKRGALAQVVREEEDRLGRKISRQTITNIINKQLERVEAEKAKEKTMLRFTGQNSI